MRLVIDIGNSKTKAGIFSNNDLIKTFQLENLNPELIHFIIEEFPEIKNSIICSVSDQNKSFTKTLNKNGISVTILNQMTKLPIKNLYQSKNTLGYDRIAAVVGASLLYPGYNLLVIDTGTAITFDFINKEKEYLGGNISPGIAMRFKSLNQHTRNLPYLNKSEDLTLIGNSTKQAINNGVINGIIFELDKYIELFSKQYNDFKTVITGGDANFFVNKLKNTIFAVSNLILIGLNRILSENED